MAALVLCSEYDLFPREAVLPTRYEFSTVIIRIFTNLFCNGQSRLKSLCAPLRFLCLVPDVICFGLGASVFKRELKKKDL